jgi:hypothetical protein
VGPSPAQAPSSKGTSTVGGGPEFTFNIFSMAVMAFLAIAVIAAFCGIMLLSSRYMDDKVLLVIELNSISFPQSRREDENNLEIGVGLIYLWGDPSTRKPTNRQ